MMGAHGSDDQCNNQRSVVVRSEAIRIDSKRSKHAARASVVGQRRHVNIAMLNTSYQQAASKSRAVTTEKVLSTDSLNRNMQLVPG